MKKIFTLITLFAFLGGGNLYADEYTVTFKDCGGTSDSGTKQTTIDGLIATGGSIFSEVAADNAFQARADRGVKLGSGSKPGSMEFTLSTKLNIQTIKFKARKYNDTETSITVNGKAFTELTGDFDEYTIELNGAETEKISISTPEKRAYITSLTILTPGGGDGGGGDTPQPSGATEEWSVSSLTFDNVVVEAGGNPVPVLQDMTITDNTGCVYIIPEGTHVFEEGTYPDNMNRVYEWLDANGKSTYAGTLKQYTFTASTSNISLKAVSTPNADAALNQSWQMSTKTNEAINTDDFPVKFTNYIKPKNGDPSLGSYDFYDKNSEGKSTHRVTNNFWKPGCGSLPVKGCYYEFTTKSAGTLLVGVCMWKDLPQRPLYVIDESTAADGYTVLAPSKLTVEGVLQDNGWTGWHDKVYHKFTVGDDYLLYEENGEGTLELAPKSRTFFGYVTFEVEANKSYIVMNPNNQMGLYGFQFTAGGDTGVETIKTEKVWNANAPMYNLSGQQVDKSYKGIVIQNGRKFVNK